jgi:uncharacterized damage-inducible protein DinB
MPNAEIDLLLHLLDTSYERQAWHGPNLRGSLRGVSAATAACRPGSGRRNIWEIVVHAAYWKYTVRRRLLGEPRGSFPLDGSNWFPRPEDATAAAWRADLRLLAETHRALREAVAGLRPADLGRRAGGSRHTNRDLVAGIASHDVYHAGQIQLLKRLNGRA